MVAWRRCGSASATAPTPTTRSCSGRSGGPRRYARARVRAGRLGHPDAERLGDRRPARGDGDLDGRVPARRRPVRADPHGASWGSATGRSSSRASRSLDALRGLEIVIPGRLTTAYLALRLALGEDVRVRELPFDAILDEVASGRADAGLVIHEGSDLRGEGLARSSTSASGGRRDRAAAALGVNAARRDSAIGSRSLRGARRGDPRRPRPPRRGLAYAQQFGRGIDAETADRFVAMYVNE